MIRVTPRLVGTPGLTLCEKVERQIERGLRRYKFGLFLDQNVNFMSTF